MRRFFLVVASLLLAQPAFATIRHVQTKVQSPTEGTATTTGSATTSISETFSTTPTVGNLVIVEVALLHNGDSSTATISSVTDNQATPNTWVLAAHSRMTATSITPHQPEVDIYYSTVTTASGTFTVTVSTAGTAPTGLAIGLSEWSGVTMTFPLDQSFVADTGGVNSHCFTSSGVTPSMTGALVFQTGADDLTSGTESFNVNPSGTSGGYAERTKTVSATTHVAHVSASKIKTAATQEVMDISWTTVQAGACAGAIFSALVPNSSRRRLQNHGTAF